MITKVGFQEDFNKSIRGPILWLLGTLFTQPLVSGPMKNGSGVGIEFIHEFSNVDPLAKANRDQHCVLHIASSPGVISYLPDAD